ncbi:MAG: hypothetical protein CM1200mP16_11950 [Nitrospina sp.]|nr:MAG: hypothetical protein CM1200mP16_11950 [Nitrospina sp.]
MIAYVAAQFKPLEKRLMRFLVTTYFKHYHWRRDCVGLHNDGRVRAVAWTDFIQGLIMVFGLIVLSIAAMICLGGFPPDV